MGKNASFGDHSHGTFLSVFYCVLFYKVFVVLNTYFDCILLIFRRHRNHNGLGW